MAKGFKLKELLQREKLREQEDALPVKKGKKVSKVEESESEDNQPELDLDRLAKSESEESDSESEDSDDASDKVDDEAEQPVDEEEEEEEEEDIPLSDVEFDSDADVVPHQKLTVNNTRALKNALERIKLPWAKHSFQEHQSVTAKGATDASIKDIYDDTERELAFYKQALAAVSEAKQKLQKLRVPFERPSDYFAEMVKTDEHMDKIKGKLVQEYSEKKAREDARKQRQLKKFGKQVQVATLQKRQMEKRQTLDKIKDLKKKRKHSDMAGEDFNVHIEQELEDSKPERSTKPSKKRQAKNSRYGQGGMKRFKRKNDADSSANITDFNPRKMKSRPGKARRHRN